MNVDDFKEVVVEGMQKNFLATGKLIPLAFVLWNKKFSVLPIPLELFEDESGKDIIVRGLKQFAIQKEVEAIAMVFEAFGAVTLNETEDFFEIEKIIKSGGTIRDFKKRLDLICCTISTRESQELNAFRVDCEKKLIIEPFGAEGITEVYGRFSNFFATETLKN